MYIPWFNEFQLIIPSVAAGTRPASAWGTSVTPAQNAYGSYAQLLAGASVTDDVYEIEIEVNTVGISAAARDCIVTIGFDAAGGTSYTDAIIDLVCGPASPHASGTQPGGVTYRFPLFIKSGTSIGAKASVNSATLTAIDVACVLRCKPSRPEHVRVGTYVTTFGSTPASSNGTAITPGTAAEGAWTSIGTLAADYIYFEFGYGVNSATMTLNTLHVDVGLGDASFKRVVIQDHPIVTTTVETLNKPPGAGRYALGKSGDIVYARSQVGPSAADTSNSIAVYAVGR